jgi:hypothetical protein
MSSDEIASREFATRKKQQEVNNKKNGCLCLFVYNKNIHSLFSVVVFVFFVGERTTLCVFSTVVKCEKKSFESSIIDRHHQPMINITLASLLHCTIPHLKLIFVIYFLSRADKNKFQLSISADLLRLNSTYG